MDFTLLSRARDLLTTAVNGLKKHLAKRLYRGARLAVVILRRTCSKARFMDKADVSSVLKNSVDIG